MVKRALEGLPGVRQADVSFSTKQAVVRYEADKIGVAEMIRVIKGAGFSASLHQ